MTGEPMYCPLGECPRNNNFVCAARAVPLAYTAMGGIGLSAWGGIAQAPYMSLPALGYPALTEPDWKDWHNCPFARKRTD